MGKHKTKKISKANPPAKHTHSQQQQLLAQDHAFAAMAQQHHAQAPEVSKCEYGLMQVHMLHVGRYYRLRNGGEGVADVGVLGGGVDINGRVYWEVFGGVEGVVLGTVQGALDGNCESTHADQNNKEKHKGKNIENNYLSKTTTEVIRQLRQHPLTQQAQQPLPPLCQQKLDSTLNHYLQQFEPGQHLLIFTYSPSISPQPLSPETRPWQGLAIDKLIHNGDTTLLIGPKNTGKSTLCEYLLNHCRKNKSEIAVLDADIGRNRSYPGSVSYLHIDAQGREEALTVWVGEYTPLNNIPTYLKAVGQLYAHHRDQHFTSSLVVNTMGYLTGVGELVLYEIYNILKPQRVQVLEGPGGQKEYSLGTVCHNLAQGGYVDRLYFGEGGAHSTKTSTRIQKFTNLLADQKSAPERFESLLASTPVRSLQNLITFILGGRLVKLDKQVQIYHCGKGGQMSPEPQPAPHHTDMRVVILGSRWRGDLVRVLGLGYGYGGAVFVDAGPAEWGSAELGVLSEGIDFERTFYQVKQSRMIQLEDELGGRVGFVGPVFRALGNKGMRNNPAKKGA